MAYHILHRRWQRSKPVWVVMIFELLGLVPILVLFGISQPDLYRTKMWQIGYDNHFNSNPSMILYAYANHRPLPTIPLVWSQLLTNFNVAISVVTLFILLVKLIAFIMHFWWPLVGLLINIGMVSIWTVSVYGQMGPDYADPRYPSAVAWYIAKSCSYAEPYNLVRSCMLAKASFGLSVYMLFLYTYNLVIAIWAMLPRDGADFTEDDEEDVPASKEEKLEMQSMKSPTMPPMPLSPRGMPYTPRTQAFHTLDRKLPLRYS